jgi:hypothetical protein
VVAAEADIASRGYLVDGSRGQAALNKSLAEVRQSRLALGKLLGQLDLPDTRREAVRLAQFEVGRHPEGLSRGVVLLAERGALTDAELELLAARRT